MSVMRFREVMADIEKVLDELAAEGNENYIREGEEVGPFAVLCLVEYEADPGMCPIVWEGYVSEPLEVMLHGEPPLE